MYSFPKGDGSRPSRPLPSVLTAILRQAQLTLNRKSEKSKSKFELICMANFVFFTSHQAAIMASGKSKTSFCIDSLLAQDKLPSSDTIPSQAAQAAAHQQLMASSYGESLRFRSNLFGGLHHHHYPSFETSVESAKNKTSDCMPADGDRETDGRQSSSSSTNKEDGPITGNERDGGQHVVQQPNVSCWTQPHSMTRMIYGPPTSSGSQTIPVSNINLLTSSSSSSTTASSTSGSTSLGNYPGPLFTSPAAALHAAAAAAAAAVAASSPAAHQFHSAHLEWLARAGVLYHRFGADLSG